MSKLQEISRRIDTLLLKYGPTVPNLPETDMYLGKSIMAGLFSASGLIRTAIHIPKRELQDLQETNTILYRLESRFNYILGREWISVGFHRDLTVQLKEIYDLVEARIQEIYSSRRTKT